MEKGKIIYKIFVVMIKWLLSVSKEIFNENSKRYTLEYDNSVEKIKINCYIDLNNFPHQP